MREHPRPELHEHILGDLLDPGPVVEHRLDGGQHDDHEPVAERALVESRRTVQSGHRDLEMVDAPHRGTCRAISSPMITTIEPAPVVSRLTESP
jgi:hypothetical protein